MKLAFIPRERQVWYSFGLLLTASGILICRVSITLSSLAKILSARFGRKIIHFLLAFLRFLVLSSALDSPTLCHCFRSVTSLQFPVFYESSIILIKTNFYHYRRKHPTERTCLCWVRVCFWCDIGPNHVFPQWNRGQVTYHSSAQAVR